MSPKPKREFAREHCESARRDLEEGREKDAVNALFYAAEAAVVALADYHDIETRKHHGRKADAASELYEPGLLSADFGPSLRELNRARKDVWYEGDEPDLDESLGEILDRVELLVQAAGAGS